MYAFLMCVCVGGSPSVVFEKNSVNLQGLIHFALYLFHVVEDSGTFIFPSTVQLYCQVSM